MRRRPTTLTLRLHKHRLVVLQQQAGGQHVKQVLNQLLLLRCFGVPGEEGEERGGTDCEQAPPKRQEWIPTSSTPSVDIPVHQASWDASELQALRNARGASVSPDRCGNVNWKLGSSSARQGRRLTCFLACIPCSPVAVRRNGLQHSVNAVGGAHLALVGVCMEGRKHGAGTNNGTRLTAAPG